MDIKRIIIGGAAAIFGIGVAVFLWIWFAPCALGGCAPLDRLAEYQAEGSSLLDINGEQFARLATVNRRIISIDSVPDYLPEAFVAIEDRRFYDHHGVDFTRTLGALMANVRSGGVEEGGSTISQQLARNLFPEWLPYTERSIRRKIMEARVARQIERSFSKDKILELYMNHIYLGDGAYGVDAAAQTYFGKPAAELDLAEAAMIAGLAQAPSRGNPRENMERATNRRNLVLDQMADLGYITEAEAAEAEATEIVLDESESEAEGPESSYFVERVRQELEERVGNRFYTAGLQIYTTLDPVAQQSAEEELSRQLRAIESGRFGTFRHSTYESTVEEEGAKYLQGAVVVMDAQTGEVRAEVGGRDFNDSKFDRVTQAERQPGSAFKPFVYLAGLERFRTPAHIVEDSPVRMTLSGGQVWEPRNYGGSYDGDITMREAITRSKNAATVRLAEEVGIRSAIGVAHDLGITSDIPDYPSTALGAAVVRPIELVSAYAAFGNGGNRVQPTYIRKVVDKNGIVLWENQPRVESVLDPAVAYVLTTMLRDVVDRGTGSAVRAVGFRGAAAGKTGTTNDASDVWFVGYTPKLAAAVWIGFDEPQTIVRGASGGTLAAPVWGRMMRTIYDGGGTQDDWPRPSGVTTADVDRATGAAVSENCRPQGPVITEYFIRTSPPSSYCPSYDYDSRYSLDDSLWVDEEWSEYDIDLPDRADRSDSTGIDWPELDALRRRVRRGIERAGQQATDADSSRAIPDANTGGVLGDPENPRQPAGAGVGIERTRPTTSQPGAGTPSAAGNRGVTPPGRGNASPPAGNGAGVGAAPPPPSGNDGRAAPDAPSPPPEDDGPDLLGTPTTQ